MEYYRKRNERSQYDIGWEQDKVPASVIIPLRDKFNVSRIMKREPLLFHIMLKQRMTWFPLVTKVSSEVVQ